MADPLSIYGAVATSFELFGQFLKICRRFGDLPRTLDAVNRRLQGYEYALKDWKNKFRIESHRPLRFYQALWGDDEPKVRHLLNVLQICCKGVKKTLNKMVSKALPDMSDAIYDGRVDEAAMNAAVREIKQQIRGWTRLKAAVMNEVQDLEDDLKDFERDLAALTWISKVAFREQHGTDLEQFDASRLTGRGLFYRQTRKNAQMLHDAYKYEDDPIRCYLVLEPLVFGSGRDASRDSGSRRSQSPQAQGSSQQLNALGPRSRPRARSEGDVGSQSLTVYRSARSPGIKYRENVKEVDPKRHFQFLLQYRGISRPIVIRPASLEGTKRALKQVIICNSFIGAIAELREDEICTLEAPNSDRKQFRIQQYEHPALVQLDRATSFESRLASLSYKEKCQIAYVISDGLFRLIGSAWGNYLQRINLRTTRASGSKWAIGMEAAPVDSFLGQALRDAEIGCQYPGVSLTPHAQIFRLGVVLAELGLGRPLRHIRLHDRNKFQLDFGQGKNEDTWRISCDVVRETSDSYGKVVDFCLSIFERGNYTEKKNLDHEFEYSVLNPLEELYKVSQS